MLLQWFINNNCVFFVNFAKLSLQLKLTEMVFSFSKRKENIQNGNHELDSQITPNKSGP